MHLGTFTTEGTWQAAARELPELKATGITVLEIMPISDFAGRFGWGYDGVNFFAPTRLYGTPDDARRFIDRAHSLGLAVILDVVYNHLGPDGNYLGQFSADYVTDRYKTDWGPAMNYDGPNAGPVREYVAGNAAYWIDEYHFDGLRLDATQNIYDSSADHILTVIGRRVRSAAKGRATIIVAENEPQDIRLVCPVEDGGHGFDGMWNDDYHHTARVALTNRTEAYFTDYRGTPQEFISTAKYGFLYQGQQYIWQKKRRGSRTTCATPATFITFLENHDQVSNTGGKRPHQLTSPGRYRAMTALTLLSPGTPMLFQGQEFASSQPFYFFADHKPELARLVYKGARSSSPSSPPRRTPRCRSKYPTRPIRRHLNAASSIFPNVKKTPRCTRCTATCCACGARSRHSAPSVLAASMGPCSARRRSCCASSERTRWTTGCFWSIWVTTCCWRPRRSLCWLPMPAWAGKCCGRARTCAMGAIRPSPWRGRTVGVCLANRPWS